MSKFPSSNYLNDLHPDQKIYRIFKPEHFEELYHEGRLGLIRPSSWPDTYENFLFHGTVDVDGHPVSLDTLRDAYYCQCWTLRDESASMWDRYSHEKKGVRVRTTAHKLAEVLYSMAYGRGTGHYVSLNSFIGRVNYVPQAEIDAIMKDKAGRLAKLIDSTARTPAIGLMMKRDAFDDEREVRAFYRRTAKENVGNLPVLHCGVPEDFIEEVCFHPQLPNDEYLERAEHIKLNGVTAPVIRSALYAKPPGL